MFNPGYAFEFTDGEVDMRDLLYACIDLGCKYKDENVTKALKELLKKWNINDNNLSPGDITYPIPIDSKIWEEIVVNGEWVR